MKYFDFPKLASERGEAEGLLVSKELCFPSQVRIKGYQVTLEIIINYNSCRLLIFYILRRDHHNPPSKEYFFFFVPQGPRLIFTLYDLSSSD